MIGNAVSKRYAHALFSIGKDKGEDQLVKYASALNALADAMEENPNLKELLVSPVLTNEEKKNLVLSLLNFIQAGDIEKNFCSLLVEKGRLSFLPAIASDFKAMLDDVRGIRRGLVITAIQLENEKETEILSQLEKQTGRKLELAYSVDPQILGGIILKVGDIVYDASLRAQLDNLRESIKRGE